MKTNKKLLSTIPYLKTLIPTLLTILLLIIGIFVIVIPQFEKIIMDRKREMIRELTNSATGIIDNWYKLYKEGNISEEEAKNSSVMFIQNLRYGEELKDYFWITNSVPEMIVHPYRPDLNRKNLKDFKDSHGKKLFVEMAKKVEQQGEGYVDYMWQWKDDSTRIVPKLSYVKAFAPWNWVIGTGIYIEDVKLEMAALERNIITLSFIITALSSILLIYIAVQNLKSELKRKNAEDELKESREKYRMLVEASGEGLIMILENGQVFFNKTLHKMLEYEESESSIKIQNIFVTTPESKIFDFYSLKKTQNELFNEKIETKLKTSTGKQIDVLLDISPIFFMNNSGIVINVKDITINKEIREALDYTKEKYIALTNQISIGVFRTTADKRAQFTEVNPALLEILGEKSANDVLSKSILDFFYGTEDDFLENLFNDGFIKNKIVRIKKVDGIISTVSISAVLVKNINGDLQSIDGIIEDITEQCKTDKEKDELITDLQTSVLTLNQKISPFTKNLPSCNYNSSILEIAKIMTDYNTNSILVKGNNDEEIGIITDHDIMTRVISTGKDINDPAYSIMTAPIISIKSTATIYDALLLFREKKVRHIAVKSNSNMVIGVVDLDDIFSSTFSNYIFFIEKIASAKDVKHLIENRNNLIQLVKNLLKSNINIRTINKINSLITDSITKKIISFAITKLGPPPCEFAFITLGSDGREEQTFLTDQDNAIIYDDVDEEKLEIVSNYFLNLGKMISNDLNEVGYFYCKGNIMASNVKFCQPISVWKKYFTGWITNANPQDLLDLKIFFDFRHIEGQKELSSQLHKHISHLLKSCDPFFVYLADNIVKYQLPDSMIKMKSAIDLKLILLPIVDFTRLYSLKNNINTSNTLERLEYIHDGGFLSYNLYSSLLLLYNLIMQRRLLHQLECLDSNKPADNSVHPQFLSEIELFLLKRYFELLDELKNKINLDFKGTLIR